MWVGAGQRSRSWWDHCAHFDRVALRFTSFNSYAQKLAIFVCIFDQYNINNKNHELHLSCATFFKYVQDTKVWHRQVHNAALLLICVLHNLLTSYRISWFIIKLFFCTKYTIRRQILQWLCEIRKQQTLQKCAVIKGNTFIIMEQWNVEL